MGRDGNGRCSDGDVGSAANWVTPSGSTGRAKIPYFFDESQISRIMLEKTYLQQQRNRQIDPVVIGARLLCRMQDPDPA